MVYYSSPLTVSLIVHLGEGIAMLAETLTVPWSVEIGLVQGLLSSIDELNSFRRCASNLNWADPDERTVFIVKTSCDFLRCEPFKLAPGLAEIHRIKTSQCNWRPACQRINRQTQYILSPVAICLIYHILLTDANHGPGTLLRGWKFRA